MKFHLTCKTTILETYEVEANSLEEAKTLGPDNGTYVSNMDEVLDCEVSNICDTRGKILWRAK